MSSSKTKSRQASTPTRMSGGKGMLPQSVQEALDAQAVSRDITDPNQTVPVTTYPSGEDLKKVGYTTPRHPVIQM
jgi:hypothetical protein